MKQICLVILILAVGFVIAQDTTAVVKPTLEEKIAIYANRKAQLMIQVYRLEGAIAALKTEQDLAKADVEDEVEVEDE